MTPKFIMQLSCIALALLVSAVAVLALPNGAPICAIGDSNVRNLHLAAARNPKSGQIQAGDFDVFINGVILNRTATGNNTFPFEVSRNDTISIKSLKGKQFKGVLVILSQGENNTKAGLLPQAPYKDAIGCEGLEWAGLSHDENSLKEEMNSTLRWDILGDKFLFDVNIVVQNNVSGSIYYYSQYKLIAVAVQAPAKPCGILGLELFCPGTGTGCGFFGRLLGRCETGKK